MLPPLPPRKIIEPRGWFEEKIDDFNLFLAKATASPRPWWRSIVYWVIKRLTSITLYYGRRFPYIFRPWLWISKLVRKLIDRKVNRTKNETVRTLFLRRLFNANRPIKNKFNIFFAVINWVTLIVFIMVCPAFVVETLYTYGTYGTYKDVVVTQAYRNITNVNTYAVHGFRMRKDGSKEELYFGIGPNIWYWDLYPEFVFGQVPVLGKCSFTTYGITLRVPTKLHFLTEGSLYVLNPWIISMNCTPPTVVPK